MKNAAYGCALCSDEDCDAVFTVSVPTDDRVSVDAAIPVGRACVDDAIRLVESSEFAAGPAQVDPLSYLDGAA